jgi:D-alanyl-D-alanine carboxypeptidase
LKSFSIEGLSNILQQLIEKTNKQGKTHGIQLHVDSPKIDIQWEGATGFTDRDHSTQREGLTPQHPMRIASNAKTFVAAAILRLWEGQRLELDNGIDQYLSLEHRSLIGQNSYDLDKISVRHLLSHTSGLFDYADTAEFENAIFKNTERFWTRTEQLQLAMNSGKPYGHPGDVFRYSDTGYILLGEIIENISGQSLGSALRQLLNYEHLGLNNTWMEIDETTPANVSPRVHQYDGEKDIYPVNGSFDIYGGGGLISTVGDMARFMRGLFEGHVFAHSSTLNTMLSSVPAKWGGPDYGIWKQVPGTYRLGIDGGVHDKIYSHKGHFGTLAAYVPELELAIGFSVNTVRQGSDNDHRDKLLNELLNLFDINL